ncbi:MAG: S41 family peptidase [Endomicrobium sp.]|jgi:carboxyl-terminal processing protease|nr:S41 family peptidase [Endomicrobium sp.]
MQKIKKMFLFFILISFCKVSVFPQTDETYEKLGIFVDIMEIINANYVLETKPKSLVVNAIKGMVGSLDPFSQYMEEKAYKDMQTETDGSYGGIGLRIMIKNANLTVVSPLPGTPAYKAGILPEDRIIKINGKSAVGMSTDKAVDIMRGKVGKKVKLTISRGRDTKEIDFELVREKIKIETVESTVLDGNVVYVRLTEFNSQSADDMQKVLLNCESQNMKALILDLRNNPGGLLESALKIISIFMSERKLVLTTKGPGQDTKKEYFSEGGGVFFDLPIVILVNKGSASASEIVSGAMQDFKRALIVGSNTFGKGSVQTVFPLSDGTALRLTIAKYYLPSGRQIDRSNEKEAKNGITPDINVDVTIEEEIKLYANADVLFKKDKKDTKKGLKDNNLEDKALNKALEIIRENKVMESIEASRVLSTLNKKK